jgi:ketosteroid isomerase-like protein
MDQAIALANNDVVLLAWSYGTRIVDCLGFAIYRIYDHGERTPLPAWVGFHGDQNPDWDPSTTEHWPVQKFSWRDLTASRGDTYSYEIVRQLAEAAQRGVDDGDPGAIFDTGLLADDAEWVLPTFEGKSVWRGRREYTKWMRAWTGEFEDFSMWFEPLIDAGDDRVVAISHTWASGKGSGVPVEWHTGWVIELRNGRAIRSTNYFEPARALEAAGLSE